MPHELVRMMRQAKWLHNQVTFTTSPAVVVSNQYSRVALIIGCDTTANLRLSRDSTLSATTGLIIIANTQPLVLSLLLHGLIVTGPIYGVVSAGTASIGIWEAILDEQ